MTNDEHKQHVQQVKEKIIDGYIFQCEVGFKSFYEVNGDTTKIYEKLRIVNPSPHMYYLKFKDQKIIGASPELLFRLKNGEMETYPLAGTTKRGRILERIPSLHVNYSMTLKRLQSITCLLISIEMILEKLLSLEL